MTGLSTYLGMLFGAEPPGAFAEIRWKLARGTGMGREFVRLRDPRLPLLLRARGTETDAYVGVAPRARRDGTRDGIERCHVLFVDCDTPESMEALRGFTPEPSMKVRSGSGRHAYWALFPPVGPDELERANRRLAYCQRHHP